MDDLDSDLSGESVIYISSDESGEVSDDWESDCSTDTDQLIERIEREVRASLVLIGVRIMTVEGGEEEMVADPSTSQPYKNTTSKLGLEYFVKTCVMPPRRRALCKEFNCAKLLFQSPFHPCLRPHTRGRQWKPQSTWPQTRAFEPAIT